MAVKHYVDEIPPSTGRSYLIETDGNTSKITDVTEYQQVGTPFSANDVNCTCILECNYSKRGREHNLTTQNIETENIKFFATEDFNKGDSFTFNGQSIGACTTDRQGLGDKFFRANTIVECYKIGGVLYFTRPNKSIVDDSTGTAYRFGIENGKMYIEED